MDLDPGPAEVQGAGEGSHRGLWRLGDLVYHEIDSYEGLDVKCRLGMRFGP